MKTNVRKNVYWLIALVLVVALAVVLAYEVRSDFGRVEVTYVEIPTPDGNHMAARLYRPVWATAQNKMPGVVTSHGWNNDKDTQAPLAIELSRRGFVVLAIDAYGHGDTTAPFGGMGQSLLGMDVGYDYVKSLPFVDASHIGLTGHSMGGGMATSTALVRPDHQAVVPQDACRPTDRSKLHNYNCIVAAWESTPAGVKAVVNYTDPNFWQGYGFTEPIVYDRLHGDLQLDLDGARYGFTEPIVYDRLYGSFADDTAFELALNNSTHPGEPPSHTMITTALNWMLEALKDGKMDAYWILPTQHIYPYFEILMGLAFLAAMGSTVPLANLLLTLPFLAAVATPMPKGRVAGRKEWRKMAMLNAFIAGATYPLLTGAGGMGRGPLATLFKQVFPFLKEPVPNGLAVWAMGNVIIYVVIFYFWYRKNHKENNVTMYDMGVSFDQAKTRFDWGIIGKTALLAVLLVVWLYILVSISQGLLGVEFRVEYGTLRAFPTWQRFGQFLLWLIPALGLILLNNGVFLFGQARQPEYETERKTRVIWWLKNCLASLTFLGLLLALQYVPIMLFNTTLGQDYFGFTSVLGPIFGSPWMFIISLFYLIPFMIVLIYFLTYFFRRTGKVYLGSFFVALVIAWVWAVGHQINP